MSTFRNYIYVTGAEFTVLKQDLLLSQRAAFAPGTMRNLHSQWRSFISFCIYFKVPFLPTTLQTICAYAQFLSRSFKSAVSVRNYLHGVKLLHLLAGFSFPFLDAMEVKLLLKGIARLKPHCPRQAQAITPVILMNMYSYMNKRDPLHVACWAAFLLAFFLMARKSNMVPTSLESFDARKQLSRQDIVSCDFGLCVHFSWSKTNQFGRRVLKIPIVRIPGSPLCPVTAYETLLRLVPGSKRWPAFVYNSNPVLACVTTYKFVRILRSLLSKSGYVASNFSGHSFRRGGATFAFKAGVAGELIQMQGDWKSDAYLRYLDFSLNSKLQVGFSMRDLILDTVPHLTAL